MPILKWRWWLMWLVTVASVKSYAQDTTTLREVVVSSMKDEPLSRTTIHIDPLPLQQLENTSVMNLTDALTNVPGVRQFSTGPAISKPVIRGLYGNRILVLISGMRFDNQQWQDEHGLGLTDIGLSKVEVIKGPLSILHGSEAVGGVLNLIPEDKANVGTSQWDFGTRIQTNTGGYLHQYGYKSNAGKHWFSARVGFERHADYTDGNGIRVLNSRFRGDYAMLNFGFVRKNWLSENRYYGSYNQFGFIFSDLTSFITPDQRWSRSLLGPHHIVLLNIISSENILQLKNSTLKINAGFQSNLRQEDEGGGHLSLQMLLTSVLNTIRWEKPLGEHSTFILASNSSFEDNTNYGGRRIVPDATMLESSISGYMEHELGSLIVEYGAGGGTRYINTRYTPTVNSEEKDIAPFAQTRLFANGIVGLSWNPTSHWNLKWNTATGVRAPNLSELSSNGLHEGIYTYELGDPELRNEQNVNSDLTITRTSRQFRGSISGFYNLFSNYIYLNPTTREWYGFPVYDFVQADADIKGGEAALYYNPLWVEGLEISASYSGLVGQLKSGDFLPYMPAQQWVPGIKYRWKQSSGRLSGSIYTDAQLVAKQMQVAPLENTTPHYNLLNAGLSLTYQASKVKYEFAFTGKNLLNEVYYDHMSRLKTYGIMNMGRNFMIQFKITFNQSKNK